MKLFIAEKPSMGRAIASMLPDPRKIVGRTHIETGGGIVTWCVGHVMEQAQPHHYDPKYEKWRESDLPILPQEWKIFPSKQTKEQFDTIERLLKTCDTVVAAGDPDREGELIVGEILDYLNNKKPVLRLWLPSLDDISIKKALSNMKDAKEYRGLQDSATARQRADWLVGMNLTRAYTIAGRRGGYDKVLTVGRVQTPTLSLVVHRDREIENFKPTDFFTVKADIHVKGGSFLATWRPADTDNPAHFNEDGLLTSEAIAKGVSSRCEGAIGAISKLDKSQRKLSPPLPFSLSALQVYADRRFGMDAKVVLDACQSLYEKKVASYPRTDCDFLPESQHADAPNVLAAVAKAMPSMGGAIGRANPNLKSRAWDDSKVTAHHAIIPTAQPGSLASLSRDEANLYEVIVQRYLAQFYPDHAYQQTDVEITVGQDKFSATGRITTDPGWKAIFGADEEDDTPKKKGEEDDAAKLPEMMINEAAKCEKVNIASKKTKPPKKFTSGTLIAAMKNVHLFVTNPDIRRRLKENQGIGTEATRSATIDNLTNRGLLEKEGKYLRSTPAASSLIDALPVEVSDPGMTALWENGLEGILQGKTTIEFFLQHQSAWVKKLVEQIRGQTVKVAGVEAGDGKGKRSFGGSKSGFEKKTEPIGPLDDSLCSRLNSICPACKQGKLAARTVRSGEHAGKQFLGCTNYPTCKHSVWPERKKI